MTPDGLYVHVPFCDGKCGYCAFYSVFYRKDIATRYLKALAVELKLVREEFPDFRPTTVYIGGGTPTMLQESQLANLFELIGGVINRDELKEWTMEANPGSITPGKLTLAMDAGVDRISIGAQSFDDKHLRRLGRRHSRKDILDAIRMVRDAECSNMGLDLICGIPGMDMESWTANLNEAAEQAPEHLSVYDLTAEEGTDLCDEIACGVVDLNDEEEEVARLDLAERVLSGAGYRRYEISNYALPEFECIHNVSCWKGGEYIGIGPAAASHMASRRWSNVSDLNLYIRALESGKPPQRDEEKLSAHTRAMELLMLGLRTSEGVSLAEIARLAGVSPAEEKKWVAVFEGLLDSDVLVERDDRWVLTNRGRNLADYVTCEIMNLMDLRTDDRG